MSYEKSCGAVVFRKYHGNIELLLIKHVVGGHWSFPKGHVEAGESERQTALREVREETGLTGIKLMDQGGNRHRRRADHHLPGGGLLLPQAGHHQGRDLLSGEGQDLPVHPPGGGDRPDQVGGNQPGSFLPDLRQRQAAGQQSQAHHSGLILTLTAFRPARNAVAFRKLPKWARQLHHI